MAIPPAGPAPLAADASADLALPAESGADVSLSAFRVAVRCRPLLPFERQQESVLELSKGAVNVTQADPEEVAQTTARKVDMLFVRGDVIILISPPLRTS